MLGRSKSLRMLRGGKKETDQRDASNTVPQPALSAVDLRRLRAATSATETTPEMPSRPKTSGGPDDRSTRFHKKATPAQQSDASRLDVSHVPSTKSTTTLHTGQLSTQEGIIGIALGSPTMPPQHWNASTNFVTQNQGNITRITSNNQPPEPPRPVNQSPVEAPKPKISRWKSLFRKNSQPPRQNKDNFYQLAKTVQPTRTDSLHDNDSVASRSLIQLEDSSAAPSPTYTFKSDIRPSRKVHRDEVQTPTDRRPRALTAGSSSSGKMKSPLSRYALSPRPEIPTQSSVHLCSTASAGTPKITAPQARDHKPLLDVNIPSVQLERYSVMFGDLLLPNTPDLTSSPSLLERRQGNTDKVKPLSRLTVKNDDQGLHRRATSPSHHGKSPSGNLSLFPSPTLNKQPSPHVIANRPRPLLRSKTAPATSPSQPEFPSQPTKKPVEETDYPDTPSLSHTESPVSDRSFDYDTEEIAIVATPDAPPKSWRPQVQDEEPVWEIIQRQPSTVTKASALRSHPAISPPAAPQEPAPTPVAASTRAVTLNRAKSTAALSSKPRMLGAERLEVGTQAKVGIARSVSVSRATRSPSTLSPGSAKSPSIGIARSVSVSRASRTPSTLSPASSRSAGEALSPGSFVGAQGTMMLTPTLVEYKNRRSHRVTMVEV